MVEEKDEKQLCIGTVERGYGLGKGAGWEVDYDLMVTRDCRSLWKMEPILT